MPNYQHAMDNDNGLSIDAIGTTTAPMRDQLDELKAKIRLGMSKLELGFWGAGKGSQQNPTPGSYGKDQRQAMKELARVNDIELSTHATPIGIGGISGITERGYSDDARKMAMDEIKRAIEFAADVTDGGAVVFHAGEFNRPIKEGGLRNGDKLKLYEEGYKPEFAEHDRATEMAQIAFVDKRTQQVQQQSIPLSQAFSEPITDNDGQVQVYTETDVNPQTGKIIDPITGDVRYPGDPKLRRYTFRDVIEETKKHNDLVKKGGVDPALRDFADLAKRELSPIEYFQAKQTKNKILGMRGQEAYQKRFLDDIERTERDPRFRNASEAEKRSLQEQKNHFLEGIAQMRGQEIEMRDQIANMQDLESFALEKTTKGLADLGIFTMQKQKSEEMERRKRGEQGFKKDLFVAPENVFPEQYGGHPDELIRIIKEGRQTMEKQLVQTGWEKKKAHEAAEKHIKATFDIAHANLWKRFYTGDEKGYWEWYWKQINKLQKENVLGHIHVTDNFGYADEHVSPGQGVLPVKKLVEQLKKSDVDFIVEPGWRGDQAIIDSFKEFGSPIYGLSRSNQSDPWGVIDSSYFGRTSSPYFVVGEYAQSLGQTNAQSFSSWAGVPFE